MMYGQAPEEIAAALDAAIASRDNAFGIMGLTRRLLKTCGRPQQEIDAYMADAKSGDYEHLCDVSHRVASRMESEMQQEVCN